MGVSAPTCAGRGPVRDEARSISGFETRPHSLFDILDERKTKHIINDVKKLKKTVWGKNMNSIEHL